MLTHTAPARYPPRRVGVGIRNFLDGPNQPPAAWVVDRVRVPLFSLIVLIIGISAFTADNNIAAQTVQLPPPCCFVPRQNCTGVTVRLSAFSSAPCVGPVRATGEPNLSCTCDQPRNESATNMGHIGCEWTTWLPGLLNSTTPYCSVESLIHAPSWLPPTTDTAKRMVSADLPAIGCGHIRACEEVGPTSLERVGETRSL